MLWDGHFLVQPHSKGPGSPGCCGVALPCWGLGDKGPLPKPSLKHSPLLPGIFRRVACASVVKKALFQGGKNPSNSPGGKQGVRESRGQRQSSDRSILIAYFLTPKCGWWGCWGAGRASAPFPWGAETLWAGEGSLLDALLDSCPPASAAALPWHRAQTVPEPANIQLEWPRQKRSVCL